MPNVKEQTFDRVHDTQFIYRQLLDAFARPGQISSIALNSTKLSSLSPLQAMVTCFAMTLFDGEVSISIEMEDKQELEAYVRQQTFSRIGPASEADYVIAKGSMGEDQIYDLLSKLKNGTLIRPEDGATVFIHVDGMDANKGTEGNCWTLTGPGIQDVGTLCVQGLPKAWIDERTKLNAEYPLGIDMVLFTESGQLTALPRTTIMREEGV
ncbi:phosphonate C-P lyase system protein PhnH [Paenibacillus agricola]|uniref:Phosphonate C-P lyase system protein PhnH n=1 Tax=Paenibacillus agricola TaxID=2716264 RepID=A0ABX0JGZ1_9BACL|nr:phosphonate C-P lyase system protein PhnH [Paenibacillus agricola]NHN34167.1 phosphonate C-P lyase system protein PhnH [Paenibacillus agricola]